VLFDSLEGLMVYPDRIAVPVSRSSRETLGPH
jgi:hypothetical protein